MNFDNVKSIVDNRMCEPEDTEKQANNLAKHVIEKEENQKAPKKDSFNDMHNLASAKNTGSTMLLKTIQQQKEENPDKFPKKTDTKSKKKGPGRPPKKDSEKKETPKRGPGRPPKKDKEDK